VATAISESFGDGDGREPDHVLMIVMARRTAPDTSIVPEMSVKLWSRQTDLNPVALAYIARGLLRDAEQCLGNDDVEA